MSERCILLGVDWPGAGTWPLDDDLAELEDLACAAGAEVCATVVQVRPRPDPATLAGSGKVREAAEVAAAASATTLICNRDLSPRQLRNLGEATRLKVIDRTQLILDIFARRARTREARLQVELAQLHYLLPRLVGARANLSRTGGGIGTRGPGETQLEVDRRRLRHRISVLERDIEAVRQDRRTQRGARAGLPSVVLVGYTNAGKSTLMNALTGAGVLAQDALFATLDPTSRLLKLPEAGEVILSDTVGFVHDLPHHLVAAFRATLEEVARADVLVHVVDAAHPRRQEQVEAVEAVLDELGAGDRPRIAVLNKCDVAADGDGLRISALRGEGLAALCAAIAAVLGRRHVRVRVTLPYGPLLDLVHRRGHVIRARYLADGVELEADCPAALAAQLERAAR
jgi:GTP-binding protein HflX